MNAFNVHIDHHGRGEKIVKDGLQEYHAVEDTKKMPLVSLLVFTLPRKGFTV